MKNQKGGGWPIISDELSEYANTLKEALPEDLKFIATSALSGSTPDNQTMLDNYITALENQDELYDSAVSAVRKSLNLSAEFNESEITAVDESAYKSALKVLNVIEDYLCFGVAISGTKINQIRSRPLIELLMRPDQVHNRFIAELAGICKVLKNDTALMEKLSDAKYRESYARVCMTTSEANSNMITFGELRDGFFPSQSVSDFKKIMAHDADITNTFWYKFITECITPSNTEATDRFHLIAAHVFKLFKNNTASLRGAALKYDVKQIYYGTGVTYLTNILNSKIDGETLENIFTNITLNELQFIVHLVANLTEQPNLQETA